MGRENVKQWTSTTHFTSGLPCFGFKVVYICTGMILLDRIGLQKIAKIASVILPVTSSYIMWHSCLSALCSEYRGGTTLRIRGATDTLLSVYVSMQLSFLFPKATNGSRPVSAVDSKPGTAQAFLGIFFTDQLEGWPIALLTKLTSFLSKLRT